jgi:hypothetical protein
VVAWLLSMPALVVVLVVLAFVDQVLLWLGKARILPWRRNGRDRRVSATGFEVLHGNLSHGKAQELKQRQTSLVLRDDQDEGAPPHSTVDLEAGRAVIRITPRGVDVPENGTPEG